VRQRLKRRPVEGDIADIDGLRLPVRSLHAGVIESVGLRLREHTAEDDDTSRRPARRMSKRRG
jgi:cell volume regulation protein A